MEPRATAYFSDVKCNATNASAWASVIGGMLIERVIPIARKVAACILDDQSRWAVVFCRLVIKERAWDISVSIFAESVFFLMLVWWTNYQCENYFDLLVESPILSKSTYKIGSGCCELIVKLSSTC